MKPRLLAVVESSGSRLEGVKTEVGERWSVVGHMSLGVVEIGVVAEIGIAVEIVVVESAWVVVETVVVETVADTGIAEAGQVVVAVGTGPARTQGSAPGDDLPLVPCLARVHPVVSHLKYRVQTSVSRPPRPTSGTQLPPP